MKIWRKTKGKRRESEINGISEKKTVKFETFEFGNKFQFNQNIFKEKRGKSIKCDLPN